MTITLWAFFWMSEYAGDYVEVSVLPIANSRSDKCSDHLLWAIHVSGNLLLGFAVLLQQPGKETNMVVHH